MNSIKILIFEDNPQEAQLLNLLLSENYDIVGPAHDLNEAQELLKKEPFDLAILDIYVGSEPQGITLANEISENYPMPIIFLTSASDRKTFKDAMLSKPYAYLIKPLKPHEIQFTIELALEKYAEDDGQLTTKDQSALKINDNLFIKKGNALNKISIQDIFYIESDDKYCYVFTQEKRFLVQRSLRSFSEMLPEIFLAIHRKYLVNKNCITSIHPSDYTLTLTNEKVLPVSQRYRKTLLELINIIK
jgi:DNA-binding LytR/AlgR family response regulator